jgi:hypothetical protein
MLATTIISLVSTPYVTFTGNDHETVFILIHSTINFFDCDLIAPNEYIGSSPIYEPVLNFHIPRFKNIMNILHHEELIVITMDHNTLQGSGTANACERVRIQEP